jgi:hypothetical protein
LFVEGVAVTVTGRGDRFDPNSCYLSTIEFEDGSRAERYGQLITPEETVPAVANRPMRLADGRPNLSGDWAPEQLVMTDPEGRGGALVLLSTVDQFEPGEGRIGDPTLPGQGGARQYSTREVTLTEAGQAAADEFETYSPEFNPRMRCETTSVLFDWTFDGPVNRITQNRTDIVIQYGQMNLKRTVYMNMKQHPANIKPTRAGHSIGRWEGDTLVVDTVGFLPGILNGNTRHGERLHVIEKFTLDPKTWALSRTWEAEDPDYLKGKASSTNEVPVLPADAPYTEDKCKEQKDLDYSKQTGQK